MFRQTSFFIVCSLLHSKNNISIVPLISNIAVIINELNHGRSIGEVIKGRDAVLKRVREIREGRGK